MQKIILKNLREFLIQSALEYHQSLSEEQSELKDDESRYQQIEQIKEDHVAYIDEFKNQFEDGVCFALSIIHGAMHQSGHLVWWENLLSKICNWKGQISDLSKKERQEFERALNYIFILHGQSERVPDFFPEEVENQFKVLEPKLIKPFKIAADEKISEGTSFFEIIIDDTIEHIHSQKTLSGYFEINQLNKLFSKNIADKICLASNDGHTIRIGFDEKNQEWLTYNSNYDHVNSPIIHRTFENKKDWLIEIVNILGHSLRFDILSLEKNQTNKNVYYDNLLEKNPVTLLRNGGLLQLLISDGKATSAIINEKHDDPALRFHMAKALRVINNANYSVFELFLSYADVRTIFKLIDHSISGDFVLNTVIDEITKLNAHGQTLWATFIRENSETLVKFLDEVDRSPRKKELIPALAYSITLTNKNKLTGLHFIAQECGIKVMEKLLILARDYPELRVAITNLLTAVDEDNSTALQHLLSFTPSATPHLLALADTSILGLKFRLSIAKSFKIKCDPYSMSALDAYILCASSHLSSLFKLADNTAEGKALGLAIANALKAQINTGESGLDLLKLYRPYLTLPFNIARHIDAYDLPQTGQLRFFDNLRVHAEEKQHTPSSSPRQMNSQ